jgi:hypothetical protein
VRAVGTNLGFRWAAAQRTFSQAQVDGFAFDVEVLWLARQLRLEVAEVQAEAVERPGGKVQMVADALRCSRAAAPA